MALKLLKAFGRASAVLPPSKRKEMFGPSIAYDRLKSDVFNEGLIEGLDAQKAIAKGLPPETATGYLTRRSLNL